MKRVMFLLLLGSLVSPGILADHDRYRHDHRHYDDERDDEYYDGPYRRHERRARGHTLVALAHDVDRAADRAHRSAKRFVYAHTYSEVRALRALHEMEDRARVFRHRVRRCHGDPYRVRREFHALREAWISASYAVDRLPPHPRLRADLARLHFAMEDLQSFFGISSRARHGKRRWAVWMGRHPRR